MSIVQTYTVDFDWRTGRIPAFNTKRGDIVTDVSVYIADGFNDSTSSVIVGTVAAPEALVAAGDVSCSVYGAYHVLQSYEEPSATSAYFLTVRAASSSRGHGRLCYTIARQG